jgi:formylglycine-generating enzyme required for sulfatase activity
MILSPVKLGVPLLAIVLAAAFALAAHAQEHKDREFQECRDCPIMIGVPAGDFLMGSPAEERGRFDTEGPLHKVTIKAFALGKYDVTSDQFLAFLRDTGYQPQPCNPILQMTWKSPGDGRAYPPYDVEPRRWPAVCLDWKDANAYIAWLNKKVARPGHDPSKGPYRLPSEAEWEFAARAGTTTARWWGDDIGTGNANCNGCGTKWDNSELADVDSLRPNPFGVYGILGNAWQWTQDCWHPNYVGAPANGSAWIAGGDCRKHILRGGSWDNLPIFVRAATRSGGTADGGEYDYSSLAGFRLARNLP